MKNIVRSPQRVVCNANQALHGIAATQHIEQTAAPTLPPHTLMQRAGLAVAQLACAIAPHARSVWLVCGPGNNGGDGLEAAMHLQHWGRNPVVTWLGDEARYPLEAHHPPDAKSSLLRARAAGVQFASAAPARFDVAVDALLGIGGGTRPLPQAMQIWLLHMHASPAPVLCVDLPSGLNADTGCYFEPNFATQLIAARAQPVLASGIYCLSLLTIKPGLFTAHGRDAAGQVWWDDLAVTHAQAPTAWLLGDKHANTVNTANTEQRSHASHKGSYGDVVVIGGATGMTGAALLAARAALHYGAGRVFVGLLDSSLTVDPTQPELMFRAVDTLDIQTSAVVCGCGGGDAVRAVLPRVLSTAQRLVLDADALNALATDPSLQTLLKHRAARSLSTVLTPHPLEAARLLGCSTQAVQANRLIAAQQLADQYHCTAVLKGSGTVIASFGQLACINPTGNARLATAGTGDVLAGMVGAQLAQGGLAHQAACHAVYQHGLAADRWPSHLALTADALARFVHGS